MMDPSIEVPGTGQTVGDFQAIGYSDVDIAGMFSAGDVWSSGSSMSFIGPPAPVLSSPPGGSGWLSGLTSVGTAVTNIVRALDPPKAGSVLYNPATGLPYGINPHTGLPVASAQTQTFVTLAFWVLLAFLAYRLFSKP